MTWKGFKHTKEHSLNISIGRLNSPILQAQKEATRKRRELERQARIQRRQRQMEIWGNHFSPESRARISQSNKGRTAWNKGIKAWNNGMEWTEEVKQNISQGMRRYWSEMSDEQRQKISNKHRLT